MRILTFCYLNRSKEVKGIYFLSSRQKVLLTTTKLHSNIPLQRFYSTCYSIRYVHYIISNKIFLKRKFWEKHSLNRIYANNDSTLTSVGILVSCNIFKRSSWALDCGFVAPKNFYCFTRTMYFWIKLLSYSISERIR